MEEFEKFQRKVNAVVATLVSAIAMSSRSILSEYMPDHANIMYVIIIMMILAISFLVAGMFNFILIRSETIKKIILKKKYIEGCWVYYISDSSENKHVYGGGLMDIKIKNCRVNINGKGIKYCDGQESKYIMKKLINACVFNTKTSDFKDETLHVGVRLSENDTLNGLYSYMILHFEQTEKYPLFFTGTFIVDGKKLYIAGEKTDEINILNKNKNKPLEIESGKRKIIEEFISRRKESQDGISKESKENLNEDKVEKKRKKRTVAVI